MDLAQFARVGINVDHIAVPGYPALDLFPLVDQLHAPPIIDDLEISREYGFDFESAELVVDEC